jgi:hypothetical protein
MKSTDPRILRENKTVAAMITLYCAEQHDCHERLCPECSELLEYAQARLDRCPFQENKPTCAKCTVHCYKPEMRERARVVMRYAGPRILRRHPVLTLRHMIDGLRKPPVLKKGK